MVEGGGVGGEDLLAFGVRDVGEAALDVLAGVGPGGCGAGEVGLPEDVFDAEVASDLESGAVVPSGHVALASEEFGGFEVVAFEVESLSFKLMVCGLDEVGAPGEGGVRQDEFKGGEAGEDAGEEEVGEDGDAADRAGDGVDGVGEDGREFVPGLEP